MPALPDDLWCRILDLVQAIHSAETPEEARHHLQRSLPAVLGQPCHLEAAAQGDGEAATGESPPGASELRFGGCALHLDRDPDDRALRILTILDPHLAIACRRFTRSGPLRATDGRRVCLTRRQEEVFEALVRGQGNAEIAYGLQISVRTVEKHVAAIMRNCGVASRVQLIAAYHRNGGPEPADPRTAPETSASA